MTEPSTKTASKDTSKSSDGAAKSADSAATPTSSAAEKGKSARESVGGAADVHYGYFSNVKTPAYRKGWDSIWGKKRATEQPAAKPGARPRGNPAPVAVSLTLDALPAEVRAGLAEAARRALKKRRLSYDRHDEAGAIDWRIECRVKR